MRKMMTKEVTSTIVSLAKIEAADGQVQAVTLPNETLLGNVDTEKAQKLMAKKHGAGVTVIAVEPKTEVYELEVSKFLEIARIREDKPEADQSAE